MKIKNIEQELQDLMNAQHDLTKIPSIDKNIAAQIELIIQTEVFP